MKNKSKIIFIIVVVVIFAFVYANNKTVIDDVLMEIENEFLSVDVEDAVKLRVNGDLNVYYLDVGQADSILIENNGLFMLIDAGNNADGDNLVNYFKSLGISTFEHVIATHAHEDHIGGMDEIINNFKVNNFYMPDVVATSKTFEDLITALEENQVVLQVPNIDDMFILGGCKFNVIHIDNKTEELNDTSIVVRGLYGNTSFLFMGDATSNVENNILDSNIDSDVLKVGHHGSKYSTINKFLNKVTPSFSIISVGEDNSYGHPYSSTITKLKKVNSKVYRTDVDGTIVVSSDGENIQVETLDTQLDG